MLTSKHSLFFPLTLLLHLCALLLIAALSRRTETSWAELEISSVELNLSDATEESQPSPPPQPEAPQPQPEAVPETEHEPATPPPEPTRPEPRLQTAPIPEPDSVVIPETAEEPPAMLPQEPEPPRAEPPRPEPPPPDPVAPAAEPAPAPRQPTEETPESTTPESGAAAARIDTPPKPRRDIKPRYPSGARRRGEEGSVTLNVLIGADGRTRSATVTDSSGFAELDEAARRAVLEARFTPGRHGGRSVESQARLTVIFKLR
jgi:periplasmic protein TonB